MRYLIILLSFGLLSCGGNDSTASEDQTDKLNPSVVLPPADPADVPRSGGCAFIPDDEIKTIIAGEVESQIYTQPGKTVSACYYRIEALRWAADFVLEITDGYLATQLLEEITAAPATERLKVNGHDAQLQNGNRILRVAAAPPFELKLSILPKAGYQEYASEADRKRMLLALAAKLAK